MVSRQFTPCNSMSRFWRALWFPRSIYYIGLYCKSTTTLIICSGSPQGKVWFKPRRPLNSTRNYYRRWWVSHLGFVRTARELGRMIRTSAPIRSLAFPLSGSRWRLDRFSVLPSDLLTIIHPAIQAGSELMTHVSPHRHVSITPSFPPTWPPPPTGTLLSSPVSPRPGPLPPQARYYHPQFPPDPAPYPHRHVTIIPSSPRPGPLPPQARYYHPQFPPDPAGRTFSMRSAAWSTFSSRFSRLVLAS